MNALAAVSLCGIETADLFKLLLALILGGLIGWERQLYEKPAGFRTNILICLGSTLFTMFSLRIGELRGANPSMITAQIVSGIGFLGAGAIIRHGATVLGLTTAATIWAVASIGVGVGAGYYGITSVGAVFTLCVLLLFRKLEHMVDQFRHVRTYDVVLLAENDAPKEFTNAVDSSRLRVLASKKMKSDGHYCYEVTLSGRRREHEAFLDKILKSPTINQIKY
jgi:putative Mg2+ transporter-C (MgtC) family protein